MSLVFHWFLPTSGDGRGIVSGGVSVRARGDGPQEPPEGRGTSGHCLPPSPKPGSSVQAAPRPGRFARVDARADGS